MKLTDFKKAKHIIPQPTQSTCSQIDRVPHTGDRVSYTGDRVSYTGDGIPHTADRIPHTGDEIPHTGGTGASSQMVGTFR